MTVPLPPRQPTLQVHARMAELPVATTWVEEVCLGEGIDAATRLRLVLLVEELFTNTVVHGHGADSDAPVQLALRAEPGQVVLDYADSAPPFDPLAQAAATEADLEGALAERPVGRLGLQLIRQLASSACYVFDGGRNQLQLVLRRATP